MRRPVTPVPRPSAALPRFALAAGLLAGLAVALGGAAAYHHQRAVLQQVAERQLTLVADLKRDQLASWYAGQRTVARSVSEGTLMAREIERWRQAGGPVEPHRARWLTRLSAIRRISVYEDVSLLDLDGTTLASTDDGWDPRAEPAPGLLPRARASGLPVFSTVHRHGARPGLWLDVIAPMIVEDGDDRRVVAFVLLRMDPARALFPLIQSWPLPSRTAEVLLAERRGDEMVFLNELRHRQDAALNLRLPLSERARLSVQAAQGARGLLEGTDDRGEPVLGVALEVPDTSWLLIAKLDRAEAFEALWPRTLANAGVALVLVLGAVLVIGSWLRQRAIVADITERKRIESELALAVERLSLATQGAGIGIWDWDVPRDHLVWDDTMYRLCGLRREDFPGAYQAFSTALDPADLKRADDALRAALHDDRGFQWEFRVRWPDGSIHVAQATARALRDEAGRPIRMVGIAFDITELKRNQLELERLNQALQARTRQAEAASRAKTEFLANVSHEIRTPMNAIVGLGHLLARSELAPPQRDYLERIRSASRALLAIINDVLDLSKIEADRLDMERVPFDLRDVLDHAVSLVVERAREKGLALRCELPPSVSPQRVGDPLRLGQVLLNLVSNAVKFTERGRVAIEVEAVGGEDGPDRLRFAVRDTGIGIPAEALTRVFQAFSQADSSTTRRFGGTGLGLTISRRLVALMGGTLAVQSVPGEGSTFSFVIPLQEAAAAPDAPPPAHEGGSTADGGPALHAAADGLPAGGRGRGRVLVAEDNETNRLVARELLAGAGVEVVEARNGREAVELALAAGAALDLVLMDVQMPDLDGLEATARIRAARPGLAIVAMTAHAMAADRARCLAAGMNGHLAKPLDVGELWRVLERWVPGLARRAATPDGGPGPASAAGDGGEPTQLDLFRVALRRDLAACAERLREALRTGHAGVADRAAHVLKGLALPEEQGAIQRAARALHRAIATGEAWEDRAAALERSVRLLAEDAPPARAPAEG